MNEQEQEAIKKWKNGELIAAFRMLQQVEVTQDKEIKEVLLEVLRKEIEEQFIGTQAEELYRMMRM